MSEPILVQPLMPQAYVYPSLVDGLIEDLRAEGLDARIAYEGFGGGGAEWENIVIWVADSAGDAVVALAVGYVLKWINDQFKKYPGLRRAVEIRRYKGDDSKLHVRFEQEAAHQEPVRIFEEFERWTLRKPVEGIYPLVNAGDRVRVRALPGSEVSQRYAGQLGMVMRYPTMSPGSDYTILVDDGTEILLRREAFAPVEMENYGPPQ